MPVDPQAATVRYLESLGEQMVRTAQSPDIDAVHDLRVAVRRATQALRIFEEQLPRGGARKVRRRIRKIREEAGAVRDRDVTFELLRRMRLPVSDPACRRLQSERDKHAELLQRMLQDLVERDRLKSWIRRIS